MATNKVQNVLIDLEIKGAEKLAALKGSFRDLGKTIGQTDNDIDAARKSVIKYGETANQSEAVVKGQIKAFEGLREQAQMGGKVYRELSDDIATLKSQLNGSTPAIDAQRKSILELASGAEVTAKQLGLAVDKLFALRNETRLDSAAFNALGKDIDGLNGKIAGLAEQTKRTTSENRAAALSVSNVLAKAEASAQRQIASSARREQTVRDEILALSEKKKATDELIKKENQLIAAISRRRQLSVQEGAREARRRVRAGAQVYTGAVELGPVDALDQRLGDLPNTTAAFSQRLSELQDRLVNTVRGGDQYIQVALRIAQVQREASAATQGLGAALMNDLASGTAVRNQKNLREAIGQLQAEMSELNTETAEGSAKYAENARQVNRLQKELDQISNSYRTVADVARQAGMAMGGSLNPFSASGAKNPAFMREREKQEMERIAELQKVINGLADEHVESLRSAARTMDEYEQKLGDDIVRRYEEETAAQDKAYQNRIANEEDAFRKELERLNTLSQARKAAASAMGIGGREDISSLYQGIIGLSTADIRRQQEMMGKSATEVFNDIATAFEKGGRAVDLKGKSTSIGDDIAEGIVDGASKSSEIAKGAKDFANKLISAYKKAFKIQSPSKETEQKIGVPLGLGIIKGLISALRSNKNEVKKEIEQIIDPGLPRSRSPRSLIGSVNELKATNFGFAYRSRPATPGYRPLGSNVRLDSEIERMFNQFRVNIAALTTDAEIYYNLLQSLPSSRLTTNLASAASRRAAAAEIPGFIESQRLIGPGELEREISTAVAQYLRDVRPTDPWVGITADYKRFVDAAVAQSERLRASTVRALPGVRVAGALPPASQDITPAQQQRIERAYRRSSQRSLSVLAEDAFRDFGTPGLPASSFGFMADPARIGRFSGIGRALPPAIDVAATSVESGSQNLRDSVRDFFNRISQGVRSSFSGAGGGSGRGRGFSGGLGGGGGASGNFERLNTVLQRFGPLSDRSTADIQELGASLKGLGDILSPLDQDFDRVNKAIIDQSNLIDRELQKRERRRSRRRMSPMQITQAAGAVLSGGIFGGPEGFVGGAAGALVGGVGGAFAGAAIGAQVGGLRRTLGEFADYAAQISRLEIALRGITEVQDDAVASQANYAKALAAAADVTAQLNVPQEVAIQGMTRLVAAVKGAGGGVTEAEVAFKNINAAIIATGGGAEQVQGAVTALVQIFSKGKVSAEEINQIAERLPGTFNKIAEASGRTGPELTKALQQGKVGLNDLMKFLVSLGDEYGELAEEIASSQENAGARLQVAFNQMRIDVGSALKPIGADFQDAFAEFIKEATPRLTAAARAITSLLKSIARSKDVLLAVAGLTAKMIALKVAVSGTVALKAAIGGFFATTAGGAKITGDAMVGLTAKVNGVTAAVKRLTIAFAALAAFDYLFKAFAAGQELESLRERAESGAAATELQGKSRLTIIAAQKEAQEELIELLREQERLEEKLKKSNIFSVIFGTIARTASELETVKLKQEVQLDILGVSVPGIEELFDFGSLEDSLEEQAERIRNRATSLLNATERRENSIAQARIQLEEKAAQIRKQALERAKRIEESIAEQRLDKQRQIQDLQRELGYLQEDIALSAQEASFVAGGGDPEVFRVRKEIIDLARQQGEEEISLERQLLDEQTETQKAIEEFKSDNAKAIMEANTNHAKRIGDIQQEYARNVAKIIEEATGRAGARLTVAAKIVAAEIQKAQAQSAALNLGISFKEDPSSPSGVGYYGTDIRDLSPEKREEVNAAYQAYVKANNAVKEAQASLESLPAGASVAAPAIDSISVSFDDLNASLAVSAGRLADVRGQIKNLSQDLSGAKTLKEISGIFQRQGAGVAGRLKAARSDAAGQLAVLRYREEGFSGNVAQQLVSQESEVGSALKALEAAYEEAIRKFPELKAEIDGAFVESKKNITEAAEAVRDLTIALGNVPAEIKLRTAIVDVRDQLRDLTDPANQVTGAAAAIGEAFSKSFMDTITGASTAREALASFFRNVGNYFLDLAGNIIAKLIEIAVLESLTSVFGFGSSAGGSGILSRLFGFKDGGVVKGIEPFAKGGIVDKPTLFKYADGGSGRFGLMGEAGSEAIMPLRRGRNGRLGVEATGVSMGDINVNVDASGSSVQGDETKSSQLGKAIGVVVQQELIKQRRPGGLLHSSV